MVYQNSVFFGFLIGMGCSGGECESPVSLSESNTDIEYEYDWGGSENVMEDASDPEQDTESADDDNGTTYVQILGC